MAEMEALVANVSLYSDRGREEFHWWEFAKQNGMAVQLLHEHNLTFDVIPAYEINMLRPDGHTQRYRFKELDCLHNCALSGKVTVYNQILLQLLKLRQNNNTKEAS